jgi:hypothetical protein
MINVVVVDGPARPLVALVHHVLSKVLDIHNVYQQQQPLHLLLRLVRNKIDDIFYPFVIFTF